MQSMGLLGASCFCEKILSQYFVQPQREFRIDTDDRSYYLWNALCISTIFGIYDVILVVYKNGIEIDFAISVYVFFCELLNLLRKLRRKRGRKSTNEHRESTEIEPSLFIIKKRHLTQSSQIRLILTLFLSQTGYMLVMPQSIVELKQSSFSLLMIQSKSGNVIQK